MRSNVVFAPTGSARRARCTRNDCSCAIVGIAPSEDVGLPFAGAFVAAR
ncbi:MAG: hypothetical protein ICV71_04280 [Thermoleophilia bacterium]|nr:hypothetical protein [Thermoleophilia bacterium]MDQ3858816.1 hypothetical protein [Actinomycetota bacterium]